MAGLPEACLSSCPDVHGGLLTCPLPSSLWPPSASSPGGGREGGSARCLCNCSPVGAWEMCLCRPYFMAVRKRELPGVEPVGTSSSKLESSSANKSPPPGALPVGGPRGCNFRPPKRVPLPSRQTDLALRNQTWASEFKHGGLFSCYQNPNCAQQTPVFCRQHHFGPRVGGVCRKV